ncbi:MAG: hypothetical protein K0M55_09395 [Rhizobium sp.]|nr:hypothetical protein [Rhizobium sp.]
MRGERTVRGALQALVALLIALAFHISALVLDCAPIALAQTATTPAPPQFDVRPDYVGMADNFISGATGWSPGALGRYLDAKAMSEIGLLVGNGDYGAASDKALHYLGEKAVASVPVIGQWYALGQLGKGLGDWAIDHFGSARFDSAMNSLSAHFSEADWNRPYGDPGLDIELVIIENANLLTFIDKQSGGGHSPDELRRMLWDMLRARHQFEALADHFGLSGGERTYETIARRYDEQMRVNAEAARMIEADRVAAEKRRLEEKWRVEQAHLAKKEADEKARNAETCNAWLGKIAFDPDRHLPRPADDVVKELCGEAPPVAPATGADDTSTDIIAPQPASSDQAPDFSPTNGTAGDLAWQIESSAGARKTTFRLTVTNTGRGPIEGVGTEAGPSGPYKSGGVVAGASRSVLLPGQSRRFDIVATGDVKAVAISVQTGKGPVASISRPCLHETGIVGDGHYSGSYSGLGNDGRIALTVTGGTVTGTLVGSFADDAQSLAISCAISGTYNPETGTLSAQWGGTAVGAYKGENGAKINEALAGALSGSLKDNTFSGTWAGGSQFLEAEGQWNASR